MSFQFSLKMNENNSIWGTIVVKSIFFVRFLGELKISKIHFEINWPLGCKIEEIFFKNRSSMKSHLMLICAVLTANNVCRSEDSDTACPTKADLERESGYPKIVQLTNTSVSVDWSDLWPSLGSIFSMKLTWLRFESGWDNNYCFLSFGNTEQIYKMIKALPK